jgi:CheY-like chemotaxis protein
MTRQRLRPIVVLLVEDSPSDAALAIEAFESAKVPGRIFCVEDGFQALVHLRGQGKFAGEPRPDIILLDLNMPKKDGRDVLKEIKADPDLQTIPVIVFTASDSEKEVQLAYKLHANCVIVKPVDFTEFVDVVKSIENFWMKIVALPKNP